ncbi:MAG: DUF2812 domain-containing protein [Oscillospiraceae bacterium]|nr:DUF2812 domain-containing protein [Oscillospiraceae bacterium]
MKDTKRRFMTFTFYDRTGIEKDLEKQAARGWLLEKCSAAGWIFRRIEPAKIHFSVVYFPAISMFDPEPSEKQKRFQEFCEHTGWELIASNIQMQIFCNRREKPIPIETEPEIEVENIHKSVRKTLLPTMFMNLILAVIQLGLTYQRFVINPLGELANLNGLVSTVFWILMIFSAGTQVALYYRWLHRARAAAHSGDFLETRSTDKFQITMMVSTSLALIFMMSSLGGWRMTVLGIAMALSIVGIGFMIAKATQRMKKKQVSAKINRLVTYAMAVVGSLLICGAVIWLMVGVIMDDRDTRDRAEPYEYNNWTFYVYHDEIPLQIEDLIETEYEGYSKELITDESSPLLHYMEARQRPRHDALAEPELSYRIAEVKAPWLYDFVLSLMLADFDHNYAHPEDESGWKKDASIDPAPWGAESAYQLVLGGEPESRYLLCYENRILEIDLDWEPTAEQIAIIRQKLNP